MRAQDERGVLILERMRIDGRLVLELRRERQNTTRLDKLAGSLHDSRR